MRTTYLTPELILEICKLVKMRLNWKQIANVLNINVSTLRSWRCKGKNDKSGIHYELVQEINKAKMEAKEVRILIPKPSFFYIYFITPEPDSPYITFGYTSQLGDRWKSYRTHTPDPKIVGLIECENKSEAKMLEQDILQKHLQAFVYRNEWLYHTPEVKTFYQKHTNVNITKALKLSLAHNFPAIPSLPQNPLQLKIDLN